MIYAVLAFIAIVATTALVNARERRAFNEKFPPIDNDEFIRRCTPGVHRDVALGVRRIVSEQLGIDYDRVYPEHSFVKDLGCD